MKINRGWLARHHACPDDRAGFTALFGKGATVEVTPVNLYAAIGAGLDVEWLGGKLIFGVLPDDFEKRCAEWDRFDAHSPSITKDCTNEDLVAYLMGLVARYDKRHPFRGKT